MEEGTLSRPSTSTDMDSESDRSYKSSFRITVEPLLFAIFFATSFCDTVLTNLLLEKACNLKFGNETNCSEPLEGHVKEVVEPITAQVAMYRNLIEAGVPALLSFFIGPWSDVNGRKPFLISCLGGYTICWLSYCILSIFPAISMWIFLIPPVAIAVSGGLVSVFTCNLCYITDITTQKDRAFRLAIVECCLISGIVLGYLLSVPLYHAIPNQYGYVVIFGIAALVCLFALLHTIFFLPETVQRPPGVRKRLFELSSVTDTVRAVLRSPSRKGTLLIFLLIFSNSVCLLILQGEGAIRYLSVVQWYSWTVKEYNIFSGVTSLIGAVTSGLGIWILGRLLHISDNVITLFSSVVGIIAAVIMSLSYSGTVYVIGGCISCISVLVSPTARSEMTRLVPKSDSGKVFAFASVIDSLTPFAATPMYTFVYTALLSTMPMAIYFLSAGLWLTVAISSMLVIYIKQKYRSQLIIEDDDDTEPILT